MATTTVRGRVPTPGSARRAHLREQRLESLWVWPAVAAIAAWVAGALAARHLGSFTFHQGLFPTDLDDARTLLATIAAALLTFTGVVFSITLVALQMASTQYSPRVLRTFMRKPITKLALSTFIATFVYSMTVLASVGTTQAHFVAQGAVVLAFLLVLASVLVFVVFVHSTVRSMRVSYVIESVFKETMRSVQHMYVEPSAYSEGEAPTFQPDPSIVCFDHRDAVIDGIDAHALVTLARESGCVLRVRVPVGTFVTRGSELMEVHGGAPPASAAVRATLDCSAVRTLYQDPSYGVRQLVDIACRALSPAINDPTTALQVLDRVHAVMRAVAFRPDPSGLYLDAAGKVRLVVPMPGWDSLVDLAFTEIALFGSGSPQISRKLMSVYDDLASLVPAPRQQSIERHRAWLAAEVSHRHRLPAELVLTPDPRGLG
jgi:uncharacterized membrane protein